MLQLPLPPALEKFFKPLLRLGISLGVPGTWHQFTLAVTVEQTIDSTVIDFVANVFLKRLPYLRDRRDFPTLGLREKRSEEFLLFFQREILPSPPPFSWRFNRRNDETVVVGDYRMNGRFGYPTVPRNL